MSRRVTGFGLQPAGIVALAVAACVTLAACDSAEPDPESLTTTPTSRPRNPAVGQGDLLVSAVSATPGSGPVELKFVIGERPTVGKPIEVELALTPTTEMERIAGRVQAPDGVQLVSGEEIATVEHPATGTALSHKVRVIPEADGIYALTVVVVSDGTKESLTRTYSIPLIAGQGLPALPAAPAADATNVSDSRSAAATP